MAYNKRTIQQITNDILANFAANAVLAANFANTSITSFQYYIASAVAQSFSIIENQTNAFEEEIINIGKNAPVGTPQWLQKKVYEFQYSSATTQILDVTKDYAIIYRNIDESLQIIKQCAVKTLLNRIVLIKALKGVSPSFTVLTTDELNSFKSYLNNILPAGIAFSVISAPADSFELGLRIFYDAQYPMTVIRDQVITNIINYLTTLPFDGTVVHSKITDSAQKVLGVNDVVLTYVSRYDASTGYSFANDETNSRISELYSGAADVSGLRGFLEGEMELIAQ